MKNIDYLLLLSKRLGGEITPEEEALLTDWISRSEDNARLAREYSLVWDKAGGFKKDISHDPDAEYARIQQKIRQTNVPELKVLSFRSRLMRVAAAAAVLLLGFVAYRQFSTVGDFDALAAANAGQSLQMKLSDGTHIWLREGSSLEYQKSYSGKSDRRVKLHGEAYFEVAHDPAHPFRVELENQGMVEVMGTEFDVNQAAGNTVVLVKSGKVRFAPNENVQAPVLTANQKAVFDSKASTLKITRSDFLNELSWQSNNLQFVNTPLSSVIKDLEAHYRVSISMENKELAECRHTAILRNQTIDAVLQGIATAYGMKVNKQSDSSYRLSGGQCR